MTDIRSEESGELLASPEIRHKALEILRTQGRRVLDDVEKMLGWERSIGMPINQLAKHLGITIGQLRYMLFRNERQKEAKEKRLAEKRAKNVAFTTYTSSKLKFTISFPADWKITADTLRAEEGDISLEQSYTMFQKVFPDSGMSLEDYRRKMDEWKTVREVSAEEVYQKLLEEERAKAINFDEFEKAYKRDRRQAYRLFFEKLMGTPPDDAIETLVLRELTAMQAYHSLMEDTETFLVNFPEFKEHYEHDLERQRQAGEKQAQLGQMEMGLFQVSLFNNENYFCVDVTKLKLIKPVAALELYELDKLPSEQVPTGSRPSKGIDVDGLHGIKYYYVFNTGETINMREMLKFFNVYLVENDQGWIISCSCRAEAFNNYKPIFERIVASFRRI